MIAVEGVGVAAIALAVDERFHLRVGWDGGAAVAWAGGLRALEGLIGSASIGALLDRGGVFDAGLCDFDFPLAGMRRLRAFIA